MSLDLVTVRATSALAGRAVARLRSALGSRALGFNNTLPIAYDGFLLRVTRFRRFVRGTVIDPGVRILGRRAVLVNPDDGGVDFNSGTNGYTHYRKTVTRDVLAHTRTGTAKALKPALLAPSVVLGDPPPSDAESFDAHSYDVNQPCFGDVAGVYISVLVTPELLRPARELADATRLANQELGTNDPVYRTTAPYEYSAWWEVDLVAANGTTTRLHISEAWVADLYPGYTVLKTADAYGPPIPVGSATATRSGDTVYVAVSVTKEHAPMNIPPSGGGEYTGAHNHYDSGTSAIVVIAYDMAADLFQVPGSTEPDYDAGVLWTAIYELRTESDARLTPWLCDETNTRPWLQDWSPLKWPIEQECFIKSRGYRPNDFTHLDIVPVDDGVKMVAVLAIVVPSALYNTLGHPDINNMFGSYTSTSVLELTATETGVTRRFIAGDFVMSSGDYDAAVTTLPSAATNGLDMPNPASYAALWPSFSAAVARQAFAPDSYGDEYHRSYTGVKFLDQEGAAVVVASNNVGVTRLHIGYTEGPMGHHLPSRPSEAFLPTREAPYLMPVNFPTMWPGGADIDTGNAAYALTPQSSAYWEVYDLSGATPAVTTTVDTDTDLYFMARAPDGSWSRNYFGSQVGMPKDMTVLVPGRVFAFCGVSMAVGVPGQLLQIVDTETGDRTHRVLPTVSARYPLQWLHCYSHATLTPDPYGGEDLVEDDACLIYCAYSQTTDFASTVKGNLPPVPGATLSPGDDMLLWVSTDTGQTWKLVASGEPIGSPVAVGGVLWRRKVGDFAKPSSALDYSLE